ncbi:MAG: peptidylprolyl isomerase [Dehalococcoidia bacterium]
MVTVVLVAVGFWVSEIAPSRQAAVRVGLREPSMSYFVKRLNTVLADPVYSGPSASSLISQAPATVSRDIIEEEVLLRRAATLGVTVSNDEIDGYIAEKLFLPFVRDAEGKMKYSQSFENGVRSTLRRGGLTLAEYRRSMHGQRLRDAVKKHFEEGAPEAQPAVRLRQISLSDEAAAKDVQQQVAGGADFAQVVATRSTDLTQQATGGLLDWAPEGLLLPEFKDPATKLPVGQVSDPIKVGDKYYVIRVEERSESRQLTASERTTLATKMFDEWMQQQHHHLGVENFVTSDQNRERYAIERSNALDIIVRNQANRRGGAGGARPPAGIPPAPAGGTTP